MLEEIPQFILLKISFLHFCLILVFSGLNSPGLLVFFHCFLIGETFTILVGFVVSSTISLVSLIYRGTVLKMDALLQLQQQLMTSSVLYMPHI